MGSFSRCDAVAATHVERDYSNGKSRNKKGLSRSACQQSRTQRRVELRVWGVEVGARQPVERQDWFQSPP